MTIKQTIKHYANQLKDITHIPQKEVQTLILHILDKNVIWLHLNDDKEFTFEKELEKMVKKRATHYPLEYIIGKASFYGEVFLTNPKVLIPRPETELLVERCEKILKEIKSPRVLEIGTGSGIISVMLALLIDDIKIVAVDINEDALNLAKANAAKHGVEDKIEFIYSNLFENVQGEFDMCVSNPPYIADDYKLPTNVKYEPSNALFGGSIGDELLKNIIDKTVERKIPYLLCEMGYDQKETLNKYLQQYSPKAIEFYKDYEGFDRGFEVRFS